MLSEKVRFVLVGGLSLPVSRRVTRCEVFYAGFHDVVDFDVVLSTCGIYFP